MTNSIEIQKGKLGFFLVVNGCAIKRNFTGEIIATKTNYEANNWIASEWDSIKSLRGFWNDYKYIVIDKTKF
jgi:hypothetical protein